MIEVALVPSLPEHLEAEPLSWVSRNELDEVPLSGTEASLLHDLLERVLLDHSLEQSAPCFLHLLLAKIIIYN